MTVAKLEKPSEAAALQGTVSTPPAGPGDPFTVLVPGFDDEHVFEIRRYARRGATVPAEGDEVLVVFDDGAEPWVPAWWPAGGDVASGDVAGPKGAEDGALVAFDGPTGKLIKQAGPITSEMIEAVEASKITGQIVETQIGPEAITTPKLAAGSVTAGKIVAGTITAVQIAAGTITATQIAAGTITATQIAAGTIKASNIEAGTITGALIAAGTIEASDIAANTITAGQIAAGTITATQIAANTITAGQIKANTITATEIAAGTITASNIAAGTITGKEIAAVTITAANIAGGTITGGNIASGTVTASNITIASLSALSADLGTITAGTVTGATLRTAASGSRVVIDSEGLHAFNATEAVLFFNIATGNLSLKGKIEAGSTIPASTVTGELTAAQIKEITAAKVSGKLTNAQIESIEAAKLTGTIVETQIGKEAISTAKIQANAITSALIAANTIVAADIAAETITAEQIAAATITAAKIAANTITAGQIAAGTITSTEIKAATITGANIAATTIETGNLKAEAVTAAKIAALTITGSQIAASTITAGKLTVSELSAIAANLGTITAGTVTGATIQTASANPKLILNTESFRLIDSEGNVPLKITKEGIALLESTTEAIPVTRKISFVRPENSAEGAYIGTIQFATSNVVSMTGISKNGKNIGSVSVNAHDTLTSSKTTIAAPGNAVVEVTGGEGTTGQRVVKAGIIGVVEPKTIIDDAGRSDWIQFAGLLGTRKLNRGEVTVEWAGGAIESKTVEVTHELGSKPFVVMLTPLYVLATRRMFPQLVSMSATKFSVLSACADAVPGAGVKQTIQWLAIG